MASSKRILIAEDQPYVAFFLRQSLERCGEGYEVLTARCGEDAVTLASRLSIDLLITDLVLGRIDGFEVIRHLRQARPNLPVILITAYGSAPVYEEAQRLNVQTTLDKPFQIRALTDTIRVLLTA